MNGEEVPQSDLPDVPQPGSPVPESDLPQQPSGSEVPESDLPEPKGTGVLAGIEGAARGATAGLSDALAVGMRKGATAVGVPDEYLHYVAPSPESLESHKEENPTVSGVSEIAGNLGLMGRLPMIGSKAVGTMIQMAGIGAGDEISKAMLGQGDPASAVAAHIAGNAALGLVGGKLFGSVEKLGSKPLSALEDAKMGTKLKSFLTGFGHASLLPGEEVALKESALLPEEIKALQDSAFKHGQQAHSKIASILSKGAGANVAGVAAAHGAPSSLVYPIYEGIQKIINKPLSNASQKYLAPAVLKMLESGHLDKISTVLDHSQAITRGANAMGRGVEGLFKAGGNKAIDLIHSEKDREKLKEYMEDGGIGPQIQDAQQDQTQGYARGGDVQPNNGPENHIAKIWPEQNILLNSAKARVSGYLNSVRPQKNMSKPIYQEDRKDPQKERDYHEALDLANSPLKVLNKIKEGALLPKHVSALKAMYPELHSELAKRITQRMNEGILKEEPKPSHKMRQALSLFLGSNLDSSLSQPNMMAAQMVFAQQKAQRGQAPNTKAPLGKSAKAAQTPGQAREQALTKA